MEIKRDLGNMKLWLNGRTCVETILQIFNLLECKLIKVPIPICVKLFMEEFPKTQEEEEDMSYIPYASFVGPLMYAMFYNR